MNSVVGLAPSSDVLAASLYTQLTTGGYTVKNFTSESSLESYVRDLNYASNPQICFAIVIDSSTGNYQYKLRFNISVVATRSDGPSTSLKTTEDQAIDLTMYTQSFTRGMIGANTLVNTAIFQKEAGATDYLKHNIAPMYQ
jgi:hypothetical protein